MNETPHDAGCTGEDTGLLAKARGEVSEVETGVEAEAEEFATLDMTSTPAVVPPPVACQFCREYKPSVLLRWWGAVACRECDRINAPAEASTAVRAPCVSECCRGRPRVRITTDAFLDGGE